MFIRHDLFRPDSKFIQIFVTRDMQVYANLCKFMQIYASSCNNYASLSIVISFIPCPVNPALIQGALID